MERREYLVTAGTIGFATIAGCTEEDEEPEAVADDDEPASSAGDRNGSESSGAGEGSDEVAEETDDTETGDGDENDAAEDVTAVVGELIESNDMQLVVEDFERGLSFGEFVEPDEGNEFASVSVALKNASDEFVGVSNFLQTRLRDDENYSYDQTFFGGDEPTFDDGQFAPGEVERGAINFEIPTEASGLELVWNFDTGLFTDIDRAVVDLEDRTSGHELEQDLQIEVHDVGTTVEFEETQVTVNSTRTEESLGMFADPDAGNEYVIVDISIANNTEQSQRISTVLQMLLKDGEGFSYQEDFGATAELDRAFDEGAPIATGETRRGEVVYEVPADRTPLYWVFEFSLWNDGDKTFWQLR